MRGWIHCTEEGGRVLFNTRGRGTPAVNWDGGLEVGAECGLIDLFEKRRPEAGTRLRGSICARKGKCIVYRPLASHVPVSCTVQHLSVTARRAHGARRWPTGDLTVRESCGVRDCEEANQVLAWWNGHRESRVRSGTKKRAQSEQDPKNQSSICPDPPRRSRSPVLMPDRNRERNGVLRWGAVGRPLQCIWPLAAPKSFSDTSSLDVNLGVEYPNFLHELKMTVRTVIVKSESILGRRPSNAELGDAEVTPSRRSAFNSPQTAKIKARHIPKAEDDQIEATAIVADFVPKFMPSREKCTNVNIIINRIRTEAGLDSDPSADESALTAFEESAGFGTATTTAPASSSTL
ncbi:hypothetical protein K438DRAFT_1761691 [Mycena galopus ATCC 62051]|nr:hypothetical protein K438DRAFT_1761691 [Mycena galopus ATCC 62051]